MLGLTRHRFALDERRANRGNPPDRRWRGLASRAARILVGAIITTGLIGGSAEIRPAQAAAQPPIGYERWTNPGAESGVHFGLTAEQVFEWYAASFNCCGIPQTHAAKSKRLIDIEIRADRGLGHYVYDVVWVRDEGDFALESWFVPGLTEAELKQLPLLAPQKIVALDVERYPKGDEWRYSVILQGNAGKFAWHVLTDASDEEVKETKERNSLRVLDMDYATPGPPDCPTVSGQACSPATFDAILVADWGSNAIETKYWFDMTSADFAAKQSQGYQVIDREDVVDGGFTVWVRPGLPFELNDNLADEFEVEFLHSHHGRTVDLENTPFATVNLTGSPAPTSPGLADAQQGDNDDGPRAKPRDEKAKGKTERDRKPKGKKSGKRGKHGKGRGR